MVDREKGGEIYRDKEMVYRKRERQGRVKRKKERETKKGVETRLLLQCHNSKVRAFTRIVV